MTRNTSTIPAVDEIPLHRPFYDRREREAVEQVLASGHLEGGGPWLGRAESMLAARFPGWTPLLTTSCTHALELLLMAHGIGPTDEVIVPAYTFASTATCVLQRGAHPVFADSLRDHPNVDPLDVLAQITPRTRAVIVVHYGGMPVDLARLRPELRARGILLFEDAAHAFGSTTPDGPCGTLTDGGCFSFHATKNIAGGEGGALLLRESPAIVSRARCQREMGCDRADFRAGRIERYSWKSEGSSYLPPELSMAVLTAQLAKADEIKTLRRRAFDRYLTALAPLFETADLVGPTIPREVDHNAHIFPVLLQDRAVRDRCVDVLRAEGILAAAHYDALDRTPFGRRVAGERAGRCRNAAAFADRLIRLPLHPTLTDSDIGRVAAALGAVMATAQTAT